MGCALRKGVLDASAPAFGDDDKEAPSIVCLRKKRAFTRRVDLVDAFHFFSFLVHSRHPTPFDHLFVLVYTLGMI